ncbi:craniofacial development protein 1-like [Daphnia pulex]|uniref:craniofacial development protein 1-like n=1 Tax=Daphnia pulex TaxID=6669 RepID=UPI001EDE12A5|nr:craniofacial development protein 1-like [Daphnia pulex]
MNEEDFSSDSSDDDYIPTGAESDVEELSDEAEQISNNESDDAVEQSSSKKRKRPLKKNKLKKTKVSEEPDEGDKLKNTDNDEDKKQRIDSIWASFKEGTDTKELKETVAPIVTKPTTSTVYKFAGEEIEIPEEVKKTGPLNSQEIKGKRPPALKSGGLSSFTSQLSSKKAKLSTLEKSKLDWDRFKTDEGIAEDLKSFNQGKKGFLERQAFLERADVKQFEIEKNFRAGRKPQ